MYFVKSGIVGNLLPQDSGKKYSRFCFFLYIPSCETKVFVLGLGLVLYCFTFTRFAHWNIGDNTKGPSTSFPTIPTTIQKGGE